MPRSFDPPTGYWRRSVTSGHAAIVHDGGVNDGGENDGGENDGNLDELASAVRARPTSVHARCALASALAARGAYDDAFFHVAAAYKLALTDSMAAVRVRRLLVELSDGLALEAGLRITNAQFPADRVDDAEPTPAGPRRVEADVDEPAGDVPADFERPTVTLADVAGLDQVKQFVEVRLLAPIRNPELASRYNKTPSGGLLMWGPPGCGKTYLARALAGTLDVGFCCIGLDEVLDMWLGNSEKNLAGLFRRARENAPAVLFLDETDALGGRRSRMGVNASMRSLVTMLLTELDGSTRDNTGVFTIGATNLPWDVDPALRRPGRFDRTLYVPPPDRAARRGILANQLSDVPIGDDLALDQVAALTVGFSGADVTAVVQRAVDAAFTTAMRTENHIVVDQALLVEAARTSASSITDWLQTAMTAAEASNDRDLYGPFLLWFDRSDRER